MLAVAAAGYIDRQLGKTFVFDQALFAATSEDHRFSHSDDQISLSMSISRPPSQRNLGTASSSYRAHDSDDRIIYILTATVYDADGLGGASAKVFATLQAGQNISAATSSWFNLAFANWASCRFR